MEPQIITSTPLFPILFIVIIPVLFAAIHIAIAINLYKFGMRYRQENDVQFFFMPPILLALTGLIFGVVAAVMSSLVLAIERRK